MALLKLPRLLANLAIVNGQGQPTGAFLRLFNDAFTAIENNANQTAQNVADLAAIVAQLQATTALAQSAQQAANEAQATADASGGTGTSGSAETPNVNLVTVGSWVNGPLVNLTGVIAGDLTIPGSGPQQDDDVYIDLGGTSSAGEFRIVEVIGGVDTTVFTGTFSVYNYGAGGGFYVVNNASAAAVQAFIDARVTTGAVSYRLDARLLTGQPIISLSLYLFARRSA